MAIIETGVQAPDFALPDGDKNEHRLSDYRGKPVVLLFYPLDFSPVCSEELSCVVDAMDRFNELDAQLFGISVDHVWAHKAFAAARGINYPLLADFHPKGEVSRKYGFYLEERGFANRGYVVIAPDGTVAAAKETGLPNIPDLDEIAGAVEAARTTS